MGNKLNKEKGKAKEEEEIEEENEEDSSNDNDKNIDDIDNDADDDKKEEGQNNEEKEGEDNKDKKNKKKKSKKKKKNKEEPVVKLDKIEQLLFDTFQNTDIDFNYKEVLTIKLRVHDAEKYFIREFNCLIYFNSYIFQQRLNILYENYSLNAENFLKKTISQKISTNFLILIDFDDETEMPQEGYFAGNYEINNDGNDIENQENNNEENNTNLVTYSNKIEYESLFTIIFEPLEIPTALFFLMTNHNQKTLSYFFSQLYENIYLNKGNRKFDIMYFLLPNLDFFVRNEGYTIYIVNQSNQFDESLDILSNYTVKYSNQYTESIYCSLYFKEMLNVNYDKNNVYGNSIINSFLKNIIEPSFCQSIYKFNTNIISQFEDFVIEYERDIEIINLLISLSNVNTIIIRLDNFSQTEQKIEGITQMIKKLLLMHDKAKFPKSVLIIRLLCLEKFEDNNNKEKMSIKLYNLVKELINDSFVFSTRERLRKNIIECFYYYKEENNEIKKEDIIDNDELNTSHENINTKKSTMVKYKKDKIFCTYFLGDKQIHKMKRYIYNILGNKIKDKKSFGNLFGLLFDKKYYLMNLMTYKGKDNFYKIEKMFYI